MQWIRHKLPATHDGALDVCVCCGDVSDSLDTLRQVLELLKQRFDEVLFTPGNHELWVGRHQPEGATSLDRLAAVRKLCDELSVRTGPLRVVGEDDVLFVPLYSWYHASWDGEPDLPDDSERALRFWTDYHRCRWPDALSTDEERARHFARLNEPLVGALATALPPAPGGRAPPPPLTKRQTYGRFGATPTSDELWSSVDPATFFTPLAPAEAGASQPAPPAAKPTHGTDLPRAAANDQSEGEATAERAGGRRPFVISFSHFLPRQELLPEKRMLVFADLHKVSGSVHLEEQVRRLMPDVHVFGHTHLPMDTTIEGIRYVQWALGNPREQSGATRVVFGLMKLYDGTAGGEAPQHWTHWTKHYETYARDLSRTQKPPYLLNLRAANARSAAARAYAE